MERDVGFITIHGMGDTPENYSEDLKQAVRAELGDAKWDKIAFKSLYYQEILQENQNEIFDRMKPHIDWMQLRRFLLFGFSDAASLEHKKSSKTSAYYKTQKMILDGLDEVFDALGKTGKPVVLIAQSLGCQVISNYIWDSQQPAPKVGVFSKPLNDGVAPGSAQDKFRRLKSLQRFFTTGCNIPIFVAGHTDIKAIKPPNNKFTWQNFFDEDDVLGWPLKPLSPSYEALVEDIPVNAGGGILGHLVKSWNPFSHKLYWSDREVVKPLARALADLLG